MEGCHYCSAVHSNLALPVKPDISDERRVICGVISAATALAQLPVVASKTAALVRYHPCRRVAAIRPSTPRCGAKVTSAESAANERGRERSCHRGRVVHFSHGLRRILIKPAGQSVSVPQLRAPALARYGVGLRQARNAQAHRIAMQDCIPCLLLAAGLRAWLQL